jgi:tyrosine-protein kinase Etk/Wzc
MFVVVFATVVLLTYMKKPTYTATSSVLIDTKQASSTLFQDVWRGGLGNIIENELQILKSTSLAEDVARKLIEQKYIDTANEVLIPIIEPSEDDTSRTVATVDQVIARFGRAVAFSSIRDSDVIKITVKSQSPPEAALIANVFAQAYYDRNIYMSRAKSRSFGEFLGAQSRVKSEQLKKAEAAVQNYMQQKGVVSLNDEAKNLIEQLAKIEAERDAMDIQVQSLLSTLASYQIQIGQQEKSVARVIGEASDPYIRLLQEQLANLEVQRDVTVAQNPSYASKDIYNEQLREIGDQIVELRRKLEERTAQFVETLLPSTQYGNDPTGYLKQVKQKFLETQIEIQTIRAKRQALDDALKQYEQQFKSIPEKSVQFARLQRDKASLEKLYLLLEEKYSEAHIAEQSEFGYVDIFDSAVIPTKPSSPNIILNLAVGVVLGLALGIALAFVREFMNVKIQTPEELKKRGFAPLSTVKSMEYDIRRLGGKQSVTINRRAINPHLLTLTNPVSAVAESYRHLRSSLQFGGPDEAPRTILVTSPDPGEGKTTTVCNLAVSIAQSAREVLLVDTDLRRPDVHSVFDLGLRPGLSEVLSGKIGYEQAVQATPVPNLHVMSCGTIPPNPAELLGSADMRFLIEQQLRERYEIVLFDSSPVLAVTDASVLSTLMDCVIVVVSAGKTALASLERAVESLKAVGVEPTGVVLNNFNLERAYGVLHARSGYGYYGYADKYGKHPQNGKARGKHPERHRTETS